MLNEVVESNFISSFFCLVHVECPRCMTLDDPEPLINAIVECNSTGKKRFFMKSLSGVFVKSPTIEKNSCMRFVKRELA